MKVFCTRESGVETIWVNKLGARMVDGIASTATVNSHGYSLAPEGCLMRVPLPLLSRHGFEGETRNLGYRKIEEASIGEVVLLRKSREGIYFRAVLFDTRAADAAWDLVKSGVVRCTSMAAKSKGLKLSGIVDGAKYYSAWEAEEISLVKRGANPDATCKIYRGA